MNGLSDGQQALLMFLSTLCIALSVMSVPSGASFNVTFTLAVLGVFGATLKEFLGSAPASQGNTSNPPPVNTSSSPPQLPPLPAGFSVSAAKGAGYKVYENMKGDVVLVMNGIYSDAFGRNRVDITSLALLATYTQL